MGSFSNEMEALVHSGVAESTAYVIGFQHTVIIMLVIEVVMVVLSTIYTHRLRKGTRKSA